MIIELVPLSLRAGIRAVRDAQAHLRALSDAIAPRSADAEIEAAEIERWLIEQHYRLEVTLARTLTQWRRGELPAADAARVLEVASLAPTDHAVSSWGDAERPLERAGHPAR